MADRDSGVQLSPRPKYLQASSTTNAGRRKWSDWSECTESCVRTRHRLNCDDLRSSFADSVSSLPAPRGNVTEQETRRIQTRSGQDEDPDYADEGDEDDEDDSCANVEPSKTFEEQVCSSGQCKSLPDDVLRSMLGGSGAQMKHQSKGQQRPRSKGVIVPAAVSSSQEASGSSFFTSNSKQPRTNRATQSVPTVTGSANGYPPMGRPNGVQKSAQDPLTQSNQRKNVAANKTAAYIHKHSENAAETRRGIELVPAFGASESPWPPKSMWPSSTNASATDQQRGPMPPPPTVSLDPHRDPHSLPLAFLVAAAIFSLVLVAALLIGRLFAKPMGPESKLDAPNWMRGAQRRQLRRRKSHGKLDVSSGSSPSSSCRLQLDNSTCQQTLLTPQSIGHGGRLLCPSSFNHHQRQQQPILIGQQLDRLSRQHQQQQLCYFWERKGQPPSANPPTLSFASSLSHLAQQFGPSKAQKLDGYKRNAEQAAASYFADRTGRHYYQMAHQSQVGLCSTSSTSSSSTGSARRVAAKLISQSHNHLGNKIPICDFDPLYVEPSPIAANASTIDYEDYDTLDQCNQMAASSNKQPPRVPPNHDNPTSSQLRASASSSSSSSLSVLSATAQLVSNEANGGGSSSLDQAPEILDSLQEPAETIAPSSQDVAAGSALHKRRQYHMSAGDRLRSSRKTSDRQKTGDINSSSNNHSNSEEQQQQHFYEEISRME